MKLLNYKYVKVAAFSAVIYSIFTVLTSYAMSFLVTNNQTRLLINLVLVCLIYTLQALALFWQLHTAARAGTHLQKVLAQNIDDYFALMSFETYHQKDHGERLSLYINDIPKVVELTLDKFISRIKMGTMAVGSLIALVNIHYSIGLIALISLAVMSFLPRLFQKRLRAYISGLQAEKAGFTSKMREFLQGFTTFFEQTAFPVFFVKSSQANEKYTDYQMKTQNFTAKMSACLTLGNALVSVLAVAYVSYLVILGQVRAGALLAVVSLIPNFGSSVTQFLSEGEFYKSGLALFDEKFGFAATDTQLQPIAKRHYGHNYATRQMPQSFTFKNLVLNFERPLTFPSLRFHANQKYAIIGESGSGKSSLLKVLLGEIERYSGQVLIDEQTKKPQQNLFNLISYMNQETFLFNDTIKNNIDLAGNLTNEAVQELLNQVGLSQFSPELMIEDNGKNLSGGQRQRLAFARVLARQKPILILDEPTANLDAQSAKLIETLALQSAQMVIMITHHLSDDLKQDLDEIIELRSPDVASRRH